LNAYRRRIEITRDILRAVSVNNGARKTRIMFRANLGYRVLLRYLKWLLEAGLLLLDEDSYYQLTDKGQAFLSLYQRYEKGLRELEAQSGELDRSEMALRKMMAV